MKGKWSVFEKRNPAQLEKISRFCICFITGNDRQISEAFTVADNLISIHKNHYNAVADSWLPTGEGHQPQGGKEGINLLFSQMFLKNCMKIGRDCTSEMCVDLPLQSVKQQSLLANYHE